MRQLRHAGATVVGAHVAVVAALAIRFCGAGCAALGRATATGSTASAGAAGSFFAETAGAVRGSIARFGVVAGVAASTAIDVAFVAIELAIGARRSDTGIAVANRLRHVRAVAVLVAFDTCAGIVADGSTVLGAGCALRRIFGGTHAIGIAGSWRTGCAGAIAGNARRAATAATAATAAVAAGVRCYGPTAATNTCRRGVDFVAVGAHNQLAAGARRTECKASANHSKPEESVP